MENIKIGGRKIVTMTLIGIILVFFAFMLFGVDRWFYNYTNSPTPDVVQSYSQDCLCKCREYHAAVITPKPKPKPTPVPQPQPNPSYIGHPPYSNPTPQTGTTYGSGSVGGVPYSDNGGSTSGIGPQPYPSY